MKQIVNILFSPRLMAFILTFLTLAIGTATFIENDFGTASARALVYNARWFEFLLLLGAINLTGSIIRNKLYVRSKFTLFIFHLAFIIILAGAAITRYTGFEGSMAIREGESQDQFLTEHAFVQMIVGDHTYEIPASFSNLGGNRFKHKIKHNRLTYTLTCQSHIPDAVETAEPDADGIPVAEMVYADSLERISFVISAGEVKMIGKLKIALNPVVSDTETVVLSARGDSLSLSSAFPVQFARMGDHAFLTPAADDTLIFVPRQLYSIKGSMLVLSRYYPRGKIVPHAAADHAETGQNALVMELTADQEKKEFVLWGKPNQKGQTNLLNINGTDVTISYGSVYKMLPFKLTLKDFILHRYPGSQSPSGFESVVILTDAQRKVEQPARIYMNNILKYRGYRFFQSSYDRDEKGTILSVNHDLAGTLVSYAGYLLMGLGMALSLFNRSSRFKAISAEISRLKNSRKELGFLIILFIGLPSQTLFGQPEHPSKQVIAVSQEHADIFGRLLVQDNNGRIEPVNTLSAEVLRKISRKSTYKGMSADQVFLGMMADPYVWQYEPVIRATHPRILDIMESEKRYFAFADFFRNDQYILQSYVEEAYRKKSAFRSKFDNEIIRLDERINILYLIFTGEMLRVLPLPGDKSHTWYAHQGIQQKVVTADSTVLENILSLYLTEVQHSLHAGDWTSPDNTIRAISELQMLHSGEVLPSPRKVNLEVFLNRTAIFARIADYYGLVGILLLIMQFAGLAFRKLRLKVPVITAMVLVMIIFAGHTAGLILRWYVSGHAPWSNGYEALVFIAWAAVLAGLIFSARTPITLSVTAVLAFLTLHIAHLSWMDPQITNLVPVLRSYWLVIHVATITASYGFLGLGALLAFLNLVLMIIRNKRNHATIGYTILELTHVVEMALIIGLYLLAIGAFLGAVWANESWGRYWGWDPKESWALVTILVYAFVVHMQKVPGLKGVFAFNLASLLSIGSVIMTYFGVNYYLSGLHSYAQGDPVPVPAALYYTLLIIAITTAAAYIKHRRIGGETDYIKASGSNA